MAEQAQALMLAEAVTQVDGSAVAVEEREVTASGSTGHILKRTAVETGVDGGPVATAARVDAHEQTLKEDRTKSAASDSMEFNDKKHLSWSEAERFSAADIMHRPLLDQMQCSRVTVQNLEPKWWEICRTRP